MLQPYLELLRTPHVRTALATNIVGRLPNGMAVLALTLLFRHEGLDFDLVGLLIAVYGIGTAVGGPVLGRIVDFRGQPTVLVSSGAVSAAAFAALALAPGAPLALTLPLTAVAGAMTPPLESCLRSVWPTLVTDERKRETAYSLDAALQEIIFVTAPLVVSAVAALFLPMHAVMATALITVVGAAVFASLRPVRRWQPVPRQANWLGPLMEPQVRRVLVCFVFVGAALGALAVGAVSYAEETASRDVSGLLLSANGLGALIGGLIYGTVRIPLPAPARLRVMLTGLAVCYLPLLLLPGVATMTVLAGLSGLFLAPALACTFLLLGRIAPRGTSTEAFSWLISVFMAGSALGTAGAGMAADEAGAQGVFVVTAVVTVIAALLSLRVSGGTSVANNDPTADEVSRAATEQAAEP